MAFTSETLFNLTAGRPSFYLYVTLDDVATVSTTGYFNRRQVTLHKDDVIFMMSRSGGAAQITNLSVESVTASTVTVSVSTGAGVIGLTNPLAADLAAAGNDLNDIGSITLRDTGGGVLTISNSATGGIEINGAPIASDVVNDLTPQLGGALDAQGFAITNTGLVDGINLPALQTATGLATGTVQFPELTGAPVIPAGTAAVQLQALKTAVDAAGGSPPAPTVSPATNIPALLDGESFTFRVPFAGASLGEQFKASPTTDIGDVEISEYVRVSGNVDIKITNISPTGSTVGAVTGAIFNIIKLEGVVPAASGSVVERTLAELNDSTSDINNALKTRDVLVYITDPSLKVYARPEDLTPQGLWLEGGFNPIAAPLP